MPTTLMQRTALFATSLILGAASLTGAPALADAPLLEPGAPKVITAKVVKVFSGDRLRVKRGKRKFIVTLAGLDAPLGSACFANESKQALQSLASRGSTVRIQVATKRKKRISGYLYAGATPINATMVSNGFAESDGSNSDLESAEAAARANGTGLFGACAGGEGSPNNESTPPNSTPESGGSNADDRPSAPSASQYTDAQKQEIISRYSQNLVGLEVSFSTGNGSVTDTYGLSFCSPTVYSLFQISSFSGSGSTSSQHSGGWRIVEAGGIPNQSEIVRISFTPAEAGRDPFFVDIAQVAGGAVLANNRQAGVSQASRC